MEYDSDGSNSERGDPENFYQENDERVLERVLPIKLRQGEKQRDFFMPIKASTAQDEENDDNPSMCYQNFACGHSIPFCIYKPLIASISHFRRLYYFYIQACVGAQPLQGVGHKPFSSSGLGRYGSSMRVAHFLEMLLTFQMNISPVLVASTHVGTKLTTYHLKRWNVALQSSE